MSAQAGFLKAPRAYVSVMFAGDRADLFLSKCSSCLFLGFNNLEEEQEAPERLALTKMMLSIAPILALCVIISIIYTAKRHVSTKHNDQEVSSAFPPQDLEGCF